MLGLVRESRDLGGLHKDSVRAVGGNVRMPMYLNTLKQEQAFFCKVVAL